MFAVPSRCHRQPPDPTLKYGAVAADLHDAPRLPRNPPVFQELPDGAHIPKTVLEAEKPVCQAFA